MSLPRSFVLTGSSAKLLSQELSTKLRGRVIPYEVLPLSFKEYLVWNKVEIEKPYAIYGKKTSLIKKLFSKYLKNGAYPVLFMEPNIPEDIILQQYFEVMILRDVVERHKIENIKNLKTLAHFLFESTTKDISYTKLANKMVSLGYKISKSTVIDYISYFEDAYLFFQNVKYEYSLTKQLGSIKKIYCIDNGMLNAVSFKFSEDKGKLLENLIFIELKRRGKETYYYRKNFECDFIIKQKNEVISAFQVTWELNEGNKEREISGLLEAMEKFKLKEGLILTCDTEDEKTINGKKIIIAPAWRWLLE